MTTTFLVVIFLLIFTGCEGTEYDEKTVCTTRSNGDVVCTTKYKDNGLITCQRFEDASESCVADNMTVDQVAMAYDSPDAIIDVSDDTVLVETPNTMTIIQMEE